jgi:hypothetical protein
LPETFQPWVEVMRGKRLFALLSVLIGFLMYFFIFPATNSMPCQATFRKVSSGVIEVDLGSRQFGIHAALIGCAGDLEDIGPEEMVTLEKFFRDLLQEENWSIWPKSKDKAFRKELTRKVNSILERRAASDIYLHGFSASESDI